EQVKDYPYDPAKAKALLTQAGYPNGFKTTLWALPVYRDYLPQGDKIAAAIQTDLAAVGIEAAIVNYDWNTYLTKAENGEHDMLLMGWTGDNGDPDNFLYTLLDQDNAAKGSASNYAFYQNNQLHQLLLQAQRETDQQTRAGLYQQAQGIIHDDAPWVPLAHSTDPLVLMKYVRGFTPQPMGMEKLNTVSVRQ
ncbi:MAG: ABC transporter substrate-binding protein, partial [Firmicutes bacterium]|nr:ABC transporter substrate-binding protein [Bacillota bacterium]